MIIKKTGDILTTNAKIILNIANCQKQLNSKLSQDIRGQCPHVCKKYYDYINKTKKLQIDPLGTMQIVPFEFKHRNIEIGDITYLGKYIVTVIARNKANDEISYDDLKTALEQLNKTCHSKLPNMENYYGLYKASIAIPYDTGVEFDNLEAIQNIIKNCFQDIDVEIWYA